MWTNAIRAMFWATITIMVMIWMMHYGEEFMEALAEVWQSLRTIVKNLLGR